MSSLEHTVSQHTISNNTISLEDDKKFALEELMTSIIIKTVETLRWSRSYEVICGQRRRQVPDDLICEHLSALAEYYQQYEALSNQPLEELMDGIPPLGTLIKELLDSKVIKAVRMPDTYGGSSVVHYAPFSAKEEELQIETLAGDEPEAAQAQWSIGALFGLDRQPQRLSVEATNEAMDKVMDEMLETIVDVTEANMKDSAIKELQDRLFERLLLEATDELSHEADISNIAMQTIAHTAVKATNNVKTKIVTNWWGNRVVEKISPIADPETLIQWSSNRSRCEFTSNSEAQLTQTDEQRFEKILMEGVRVVIHRLPDDQTWASTNVESINLHEDKRIIRLRRIMVLDADRKRISICTAAGKDLHDQDEGIVMADVDYVCVGACTKILHKSLEHMNGNLYCFDAIDHAKRCFSLLGSKRVLDIEIRPTSMQRREERFAAQEIAAAAARTLHRIQQQQHGRLGLSFGSSINKYMPFLATMPVAEDAPRLNSASDQGDSPNILCAPEVHPDAKNEA